MFELGKTDDGISFFKLEHDFELDKLKIGEFTYFRKYLGMNDYFSNFKSWVKRPTVVLVLAIIDNTVVGWSMNEKWSTPSGDKRPVYVLRGIEVSPGLAGKGMGKNMFYLISSILMGHIVTKPVNNTAKMFFESLDFSEPCSGSPVDLSNNPGYLIFEENKKSSLSSQGLSVSEVNIRSCRLKMFPTEIDTGSKKDDQRSGISEITDESKNDTGSPLNESSGDISDDNEHNDGFENTVSDDHVIFDGKFIGEQKMMSPCKCGHHRVYKYQVTGNRKGTAFICSDCKIERYFLPLKNKKK